MGRRRRKLAQGEDRDLVQRRPRKPQSILAESGVCTATAVARL